MQIEDRAGLGFEDAVRARRRRSCGQGDQTPGLAGLFSGFQINVPQIERQRRPREGEGAGRVARPTSSRRCRCIWARSTSTTSTASAAPTRSTCRRTRRSGSSPTTCCGCKTRNDDGEMVPLGAFVTLDADLGPEHRAALQRLSDRRDQRRPGAGLLAPGRRRAAAREARAEGAAERHDVRMDRAHLSADPGRQHGRLGLPAVRAARVPRAGRAVREPRAAARRDPDRADDAAVRDRGRVALGRRQQRLHADRPARARRPRVQERDPDRRVRAHA